MDNGIIKHFRSERNINFLKDQVGQTIELLTKDNLSLIRENVVIKKDGDVAMFVFEVYLNGATTNEQDALDDFIKTNKFPSKNVLYVSNKGYAYKLFGYLPKLKKFIMMNISNSHDQISVSEEFVTKAFPVEAEVPRVEK